MQFPGDLTPEEREEAYQKLRAAAVERWGAERATAIEGQLRDAAVSAARLERLRFSKDDAPGFYLHRFAEPAP